ncbi:hypothetical protein BDR05DRAFT_1006006 [Suillus weaverae]|nr:hypothetical protein BDR05DRAFT_1006006 [Suillus weaverae]
MEQFEDEPLEFIRLDLAFGGSTSEVATRRQAAAAGTTENLVLESVAGIDGSDRLKLVDIKDTGKYTTLCLAVAHALVRLDDGIVVGDLMEKTTLEALDWQLIAYNSVPLSSPYQL